MAMNPVPVENYPSASQDGQAIPLAAVRPLGSFGGMIASGVPLNITLPADVNLVSFYCAERGILQHAEQLPIGDIVPGYTPGSFIFLPGVNYELVLAKHVRISVEAEGFYLLNTLMKWGQLRNEGSYYNS